MEILIDPALLQWLRELLQKAEMELQQFHRPENYPEPQEYITAKNFLKDLHAAHEAICRMLTVAR